MPAGNIGFCASWADAKAWGQVFDYRISGKASMG